MKSNVHTKPQIVEANGVELCVETFGSSRAPAVLLIGGMASSLDWWEDELCERLASGPRLVIRYDLRDTGQSITYPPGAPRYSGDDLVADAVGVLDVLGIGRAHVVGISMGGALAQRLVVHYPDRVATLTLMSTSPGPGPELPPMFDALRSYFAAPPPEPKWSDRAAVVEYVVGGLRPYAGSLPFDEPRMRALVEKVVDRTRNMQSTMTNHPLLESGGEPVRPRLGEIGAPTLVLHGTEDPLFPIAHGEALAAEIPKARLEALDGVGHEYPPREVWDQVVQAILEHTAG